MITLAAIKQPIEKEFELFQQKFTDSFYTENPLLKIILEHVAEKKGKQMRPIIILLSAKMSKCVSEETLLSAVSLELLHTASLIHDDVVDVTMERRGVASVNAEWNNKIAVLAGDYILSKALEMASQTNNLRLFSLFSQIGKSMSSGELLQLSNSYNRISTEQDYFNVIRQKTALLFATCAEAGAVSVNASDEARACLHQYGEYLGFCFQLKDDIFDFSAGKEIGKPTMNDVQDGKITLPLIKAMENATAGELERIKTLIEQKSFSAEEVNEIRQFVIDHHGIEQTYTIMEQQKNQALKALDFFPDSDAKTSLINILNYAIKRIN